MILTDYPRPYEDNGRGIHWSSSPGVWGEDNWAFWKKELLDMNVSWVKVVASHDGLTDGLIKRLLDINIIPIIRIYIGQQNPQALAEAAPGAIALIKKYVSWGVRYFETNNEPDSRREWSVPFPDDWLEIVARNFLTDWKAITDVGGIAGFPCFSFGGGRQNPFELIADWGASHVFERMWIPIHNYGLNRPVEYPNDPVNLNGQQLTQEEYEMYGGEWAFERPLEAVNKDRWGQRVNKDKLPDKEFDNLILEDFTCWRAFERFNEWFSSVAGFSVPIITTEGGFNVSAFVDGRYPKLNPQLASKEQIKSEEQDWPEYYFSDMYWIVAVYRIGVFATDFETQSLYGHWWDSMFGTEGELPLVQMWKDWPGKTRGSGPVPEELPFYKGPDLSDRDFDDELKYTEPITLLEPVSDPDRTHWRLQEVKFEPEGMGRAFIRCKFRNNFQEGWRINSKQGLTIESARTKGLADDWYGNVPVPDTEGGVRLFAGNIEANSDVLTGVKQGTVYLTFEKKERKKMDRKVGLWVANGHPGDPGLMLGWKPYGVTCFYDYLQANGIYDYKAVNPGTPVIVRFQHPPNWHTDPKFYAEQLGNLVASKWVDLKLLDPYVYFANEMNLHYENGDDNPENQHLYTSPEFYEKFADWVYMTADVIKNIVPEMKLVTPPFAFGHHEDGAPDDDGNPQEGWAGYDYLTGYAPGSKNAVGDFFGNILTGHYYWNNQQDPERRRLYDEEESSWHAFRWKRVLKLFETRYGIKAQMIIDEAGNFATGDQDFTDQIMYHAEKCLNDGRIICVTYFLWLDPTNSPGNLPNSWVQGCYNLTDHVERLRNMPGVPVIYPAPDPSPQPEPPEPQPPQPEPPQPPDPGQQSENEFAHLIKMYLESDEVINNAKEYGVAIEKAKVEQGQEYWSIIGIHHLSPEQNNMRQHLYLEALDEQGNRTLVRMPWEWKGMSPEERPNPIVTNKPPNETSNLVLQANFESVSVSVEGLPSDKVTGVHSRHPDEEDGNRIGHHSFYVAFQKRIAGEQPTPVPIPEPEPPPEPEPDCEIEMTDATLDGSTNVAFARWIRNEIGFKLFSPQGRLINSGTTGNKKADWGDGGTELGYVNEDKLYKIVFFDDEEYEFEFLGGRPVLLSFEKTSTPIPQPENVRLISRPVPISEAERILVLLNENPKTEGLFSIDE